MKVVIADCCKKSGKTTLALNLSAALAASGSNVLLVDADPEGQLDTLESLSETGKILDRQGLQMLRYTSNDRLQVVTGMGRRLASQGLPQDQAEPEPVLSPDLAASYDWVIFDTSVGHPAITAHVVGMGDRVLAPLQIQPESFHSVPDTLKLFLEAQTTRSDLKFEGFVRQRLSDTDSGDHADAEVTLTAISREFPKVCLDIVIPFDDALSASSDKNQAVNSTPEIQTAFSALAQELTTRVGGGAKTAPLITPLQDHAPAIDEPPAASPRRSWWRRLFS